MLLTNYKKNNNIVDAHRPADTPFHRRRPRFPRGCGAHMEQLVEISHIGNFTGVL